MGTCNQVAIQSIIMRIAIWLVVVCLAIAMVEGAKKPKGKGKPSKGKGKPSKPEGLGEEGGSGEEAGSGEEGGTPGKGKGKPSKPGKGKPEKECPEGEKPCVCEESDRAKKPKGKGKPTKPKPTVEPITTTTTDICCCEAGEGSGEEGGPGGQEPEPRGFCIDHMKVGAICMAGSSVVEKMLPAMDACAEECNGFERSSGVLVDMMRAKKPKGKGKPSKCPSASKIMDQAADKYACEICHFTAMGWLDNDMVADENMITEDIMTLPNEIVDALSGDEYEECLAKIEGDAMGYKKCMTEYTEEEQDNLQAVFNGVAHTECFKGMFEQGCGAYMENTIDAMAGFGNYGSGSGSGSEGSEV